MATLSEFEIGWLVGLLEGEGNFDFTGSQKIQLRMCDQDTVITYVNLLSKFLERNVSIRTRNPGGNKQDIYDVLICGDSARKVMRLIVPYLHYRRRQKVWQCLNKYKAPKITTEGRVDLAELLNLK